MKNEISIPEFSREDYTESSRPYEWLYEHRGNNFLLKQLQSRMAEKALSVGVRGFISMFNEFRKAMNERQGVIQGRVTEFEGQELELECGEYICVEPTVSRLDKFGSVEIVCRHPIMPVKRLVNIDSGEERLEIAFKREAGKNWKKVVVEKAVLASSNRILDLAAVGVFVNSDNAKALSTYILAMEAMNYSRLPEQNSVGRLGWVGNGVFSPYVDGLTFDGEANYNYIFKAVSSCGDYETWRQTMIKIRAEKSVCRFFLAASFASVILDFCGLQPFFVHAWGGQGTGKTVSLMVAASVWANPRMGEYISTFNSTDVGQEMLVSFLNSLPLCMDELQIQASNGKTSFDSTIYKLAEGVGRIRGSKTGGLRRTGRWKNCMLTTGEFPIISSNSMGGAVVRVIEVECVDKVYSDLVGLCQIINQNYGFAGKEFIKVLQIDGAKESINAMQKDIYQKLLSADVDTKQAGPASALLAADAIATDYIFKDDNCLTVQDMVDVMTKKSDVDVNLRALDYIYELVSRNPAHFVSAFDGDCKVEVWGRTDNEYIYFVKSVFDREMGIAGYNSTSFLSWAKRRGILQCDKDGRRTKKAKVGNSVVNTVCLAKSHDDIFWKDNN